MAQIIDRPHNLMASIGQALGTGLNKGLLEALNGIAQNKINEVESRQNLTQMGQQSASRPDTTMEALKLIAQPQEQSIPLQQPEPIAESQKIAQDSQATKQPRQAPIKTSFPKDTAKLSTKQVDKILNSAAPKTPKPVKKVEAIVEENPDPVKHAKVVEKQDKKIQNMPKLSEKQQLAADKETKGFFDEIHKSSKAAKEGNIRLDRMVELIKDGNLTWPSVASFLDTVEKGIPLWESNLGLDLHWLENTDSQEFRKLSNDFIKNAKDIFGARVTNQDLLSFMKTVPTLSQSDTGKVRVIRNLRLMNEIAIVKKNAMDEIIDENGGQRPPNLERLVDQRTQDQVDALADKFKKGIMTQDEAEALQTSRDRKILGIF
jgi:hypothetical protein